VHTNGDEEDDSEREEDDGVDEDGGGVGLQFAEVRYAVALPRHLQQHAWREQQQDRSFLSYRLTTLLMLQLQ
jgi:hypothetical protein